MSWLLYRVTTIQRFHCSHDNLPFQGVLEVGQGDCTIVCVYSGAGVGLLDGDGGGASGGLGETSTAVSSPLGEGARATA